MSKKVVRPEGSEITSPLSEMLMRELMELRLNLVNAFDCHMDFEMVRDSTALALKNIEVLEDLIRPDVFSSKIFK